MSKEEKRHKAILADSGCLVCRHMFGIEDGPVTLHHLRSGGWGKGDYKTLIPLCHYHHQGEGGIHTLGTKAWERKFLVTQQALMEQAQKIVEGRA